MAPDLSQIARGLEEAQKTASSIAANYRTLPTPEQANPAVSKASTEAADSLTSYLNSNSVGNQEKTIMEKFASRRQLAQEAGTAQEQLIKSEAGTALEEATQTGERELTAESESRRGFAINSAFVKQIQDTGAKRIRSLEKARDELLLQNKVAQASRIDSLISDEEAAITTARKSWVDSLLALSAEKRAVGQAEREIAAFETPTQKATRELQTTQQQGVLQLQQVAPDAQIKSTDTYDQAIEKYRNSPTYKRNTTKGELELSLVKANIEQSLASAASSRASAAKTATERSLLGSTSGVTGVQNAQELNNAFQNVVARFGSKFQVDNATKQFNNLVNTGQIEQAKTYLKTLVKSGQPADAQARLDASESAVAALNRINGLLGQYEASGGKTGLLKGTLESVSNKIGRTSDPKLASIGAEIKLAVQQYRKAVSGAAFSTQEAAEYRDIFPSLFSNEELNAAKVSGAIGAIQANQDNFYRSALGGNNYDTVFGATNVPVTPSGAAGGQRSLPTGPTTIAPVNLFSGFFNK